MTETDDSKLKPKHWFYIIVSSLVAIFIIVIFLIPEIMPQPQEAEEIEYNYFKFKKVGPVWETLVMNEGQLLQPSLRFLPTEVENITITGKLNEKFEEGPVYLTFDPTLEQKEYQTLTIAVSEMGMNLVTGFGREIIPACTKNETDACINRSIINCENTEEPIIFFNVTEKEEILLKGNCMEIRGQSFDLTKPVDKVLYSWYGIMRSTITPKIQPQN